MSTLVLLCVSWIGSGLISMGWAYAHFQRSFPAIADKECHGDAIFALWFLLLGPVGLICTLIVGGFHQGWLLPWTKP